MRGTPIELLATILAGAVGLKCICTLINNWGIGDGFLILLASGVVPEYLVVFNHILSRVVAGQIAVNSFLLLAACVIGCICVAIWLSGKSTPTQPPSHPHHDPFLSIPAI